METCAIPVLKPLIFDENTPAQLDRLTICTIAAWTSLRSMVFDGTGAPGELYYSHSARAWFAQSATMAPPRNTHIWLIRYGGEAHSAKFYVVNRIVSERKGIHTLALLMHRLAIKLVTWKGHEREFDERKLVPWSRYAIKIWPFDGRRVAWPPSQALPSEDFELFRYWLAERPD